MSGASSGGLSTRRPLSPMRRTTTRTWSSARRKSSSCRSSSATSRSARSRRAVLQHRRRCPPLLLPPPLLRRQQRQQRRQQRRAETLPIRTALALQRQTGKKRGSRDGTYWAARARVNFFTFASTLDAAPPFFSVSRHRALAAAHGARCDECGGGLGARGGGVEQARSRRCGGAAAWEPRLEQRPRPPRHDHRAAVPPLAAADGAGACLARRPIAPRRASRRGGSASRRSCAPCVVLHAGARPHPSPPRVRSCPRSTR